MIELNVLELLPHRDAMLVVDKVYLDGETAIGKKYFTGEEWFFQGHYPNNPIVPGVILCEILGQSACGLFQDQLEGKLPYFTGLDKIKFYHPVRPGDEITTRVELYRQMGNIYFLKAEGHVGETKVVSGQLSFAIVER